MRASRLDKKLFQQPIQRNEPMKFVLPVLLVITDSPQLVYSKSISNHMFGMEETIEKDDRGRRNVDEYGQQ